MFQSNIQNSPLPPLCCLIGVRRQWLDGALHFLQYTILAIVKNSRTKCVKPNPSLDAWLLLLDFGNMWARGVVPALLALTLTSVVAQMGLGSGRRQRVFF